MDQVRAAGSDIILGNTYHLMLRPGAERVAALGGLHEFARWPWPDPDRFRRLPGDVAGAAAQARRGRRHVPLAYRRLVAPADARALDRDPGAARFRHPDAARRMRRAAVEARTGRARHGDVAALGGALQGGLRRAARQGDVRHRAGRRRARAPGPLGPGAERDGPEGLCHRRTGGRRASGGDARHARHHLPRAAGRQAALSDGRRHARRHSEIGCARDRHVRLRHADTRRPPWPRLHQARQGQSAGTPATPTTRARSTRRATARPPATIPAPICIIWSGRGRRWAPCCSPGTTSPTTST